MPAPPRRPGLPIPNILSALGRGVRIAPPGVAAPVVVAASTPAAPAAPAAPAGDGGTRARAETLLADIAALKARIAEDFYTMGEKLTELSRPDLYGALGYGSFEALLAATKLVSPSTAAKLVKIVAELPRATAHTVGVEKAYAITQYADAMNVSAQAIVKKRTALVGGKQLMTASAKAIRQATAKERKRTRRAERSREVTEAGADARREARAAQAALRERGAEDATVFARKTTSGWRIIANVAVADAAVLKS